MAEPCSKCTQEAETGQHAEPSCPECHPPVKFDPDYHLPTTIITVDEVEETTQRIADLERWQREACSVLRTVDTHPCEDDAERLLAEAGS